MPGQDTLTTCAEIFGTVLELPETSRRTWLLGGPPPYDGTTQVRTVAMDARDAPGTPPRATRPPDMSRDELDEMELKTTERDYWKREALRYKRLLMDMLGKEVE